MLNGREGEKRRDSEKKKEQERKKKIERKERRKEELLLNSINAHHWNVWMRNF